MTRRLESMGQADYSGLTTAKHFNGTVRCLPHKLDIPLKRRKPTTYFVNSMSDLFHEDVPDEFIADVFAMMWTCPNGIPSRC
jgi:protein gp37